MEIEQVKCDCCGLREDCTQDYIASVNANFNDMWLCGLCSEDVRNEMTKAKKKGQGVEEAMGAHMSFCRKIKVNPAVHVADEMRQMLRRRSSDLSRSSGSSSRRFDEAALEEEAQKKAGWLFKSTFIATAAFAAFQFFPYMGDNLLQQSISLLRVRDPWFKRTGASRLARYAVDDERRMKVVEMGGAKELLNVLKADTDDKTRKEILNALVALSKSDEAAGYLHEAGAVSIVSSISNDSSEFAEIEVHKNRLLEKFEKLKS